MSARERVVALVLAGAAAVGFTGLLGFDAPVLLAIGLAMTAGLGAAAWRRSRIGTAFLAFVTAFGPWGFFYVFGAFYLGLAFWLVARAKPPADDVTPSATGAPTGGT